MSNNLEDMKKDLKIQALLEKVSRLSAEKENEIADLRVELTVVSQQYQELLEQQEANSDVAEEPLADDTNK